MADNRKRSAVARRAEKSMPIPVIRTNPPTSPPADVELPRRPTRARLQTFFLRQFARSGSLVDAAARTGVAPRTVQRWRAANPAFARHYQAALAARLEMLEDLAMRRALGTDRRPVFHGGKQVATVERHNDTMLMRVLARFDRLRERQAPRAAERRAAEREAAWAAGEEEIRLLEEAGERARWEGRPSEMSSSRRQSDPLADGQ
jgi:hypothetical protein